MSPRVLDVYDWMMRAICERITPYREDRSPYEKDYVEVDPRAVLAALERERPMITVHWSCMFPCGGYGTVDVPYDELDIDQEDTREDEIGELRVYEIPDNIGCDQCFRRFNDEGPGDDCIDQERTRDELYAKWGGASCG